jgi:hypothetical protein
MDFPPVKLPSAASVDGLTNPSAERMDMWEYFVEHVDEFAMAKVIVDHFDAHPKDLHNPAIEVDVFALYLRARLTLKRHAIAYAQAQEVLSKQRLQARSLSARWRAWREALLASAQASPQMWVIGLAAAALLFNRVIF